MAQALALDGRERFALAALLLGMQDRFCIDHPALHAWAEGVLVELSEGDTEKYQELRVLVTPIYDDSVFQALEFLMHRTNDF